MTLVPLGTCTHPPGGDRGRRGRTSISHLESPSVTAASRKRGERRAGLLPPSPPKPAAFNPRKKFYFPFTLPHAKIIKVYLTTSEAVFGVCFSAAGAETGVRPDAACPWEEGWGRGCPLSSVLPVLHAPILPVLHPPVLHPPILPSPRVLRGGWGTVPRFPCPISLPVRSPLLSASPVVRNSPLPCREGLGCTHQCGDPIGTPRESEVGDDMT